MLLYIKMAKITIWFQFLWTFNKDGPIQYTSFIYFCTLWKLMYDFSFSYFRSDKKWPLEDDPHGYLECYKDDFYGLQGQWQMCSHDCGFKYFCERTNQCMIECPSLIEWILRTLIRNLLITKPLENEEILWEWGGNEEITYCKIFVMVVVR